MRSTEIAATTWRACLALGLLLAPALLAGCDATRRDYRTCYTTSDCGKGRVCTPEHRCEASDAGGIDGAPLASVDGGTTPSGLDGAGVTTPADASAVLDVSAMDVPGSEGPGTIAVDVALDGAGSVLDAGGHPGLDAAAIDAVVDVPVDLPVDTRVPDAPGSCFADGDCAGSTPYCLDNLCVACKTSEDCRGGTPICSASHACVSCAATGASCPAATPACEVVSGRCVECVSKDDCLNATKPVCDGTSSACVACTSDPQCVGAGPSVCMAHVDGHCATDAETVYVGVNGAASCSDLAANAGAATAPFCSVQKGVLAARSKGKSLVVLSGPLVGGFSGVVFSTPLTVVGKNAVLTPEPSADGIGITSGELHLRGLKLVGSAAGQTGVGIKAQVAAGAALTLHMEDCEVSGNPGGGILLSGAAFDIRDTVFYGNGPGQTEGGASFGGIRVDSVPSTGTVRLERVTIRDNLAPGLSCASRIEGSGVLASGNTAMDVTSSCGIASCATASATCGAPL